MVVGGGIAVGLPRWARPSPPGPLHHRIGHLLWGVQGVDVTFLSASFVFFLVLTPIIGKFEKPKKLPASISDAFSDKNTEEPRSQEKTH